MYSFEEFKNQVANDIRNFLPDEYADATVTLREVTKNNDTVQTGLTIRNDGMNISPNIYLEGFFRDYTDGAQYEDVLRDIARTRIENEADINFDLSNLTDFDNVRDKITCKLVNAGMNAGYLSDKPHTMMEDLAVMYVVDLGGGHGSHMSAAVTDSLLNSYGITKDELHETALGNLAKSGPAFMTMREAVIDSLAREGMPESERMEIESMFPAEEEEAMQMYILTNSDRVDGASAILDAKTMEAISKKLGGDFAVLPSSIHETVIIPLTEETDHRTLDGMIQAINEEQVAPHERLSDHAYQYDSQAHELVRMDRMEERRNLREKPMEKEGGKPGRGRVSMKEKLSEKKEEAHKKEAGREKPVPAHKKEAALA